jgi:hypothetical protein
LEANTLLSHQRKEAMSKDKPWFIDHFKLDIAMLATELGTSEDEVVKRLAAEPEPVGKVLWRMWEQRAAVACSLLC